jgi:cellulose synthase (UDP-forming)
MKKSSSNLTIAFLLLTLIAVITYAVIRSVLLYFSGYELLEQILGIFLICSELFIIIHTFGYVLNIIRAKLAETRKSEDRRPSGIKPERKVAILVPARHEPKDVLEKTVITLTNIDYPNKEIYFLDDSVEQKYKDEAKDLCEQYQIHLFNRTKKWHGAKAGIINDCLETLDADYVAVFDADQNPMPNFLMQTVSILENDSTIAFVQTPQFYSNITESLIARGAAFQQAVFYEYICEGKSLSDSMFCCGTNVVFRTQALKQVGGFDESTVTEDFATSVKFHMNGWKSRYSPQVFAFGMGPESYSAYLKQQFRWAAGTISVLKKILKLFLMHPFALKPIQWLEYFLSSTYYFIGIAWFILMICPILYLLFNVPSFFARPTVYFLSFLPYIILSMSVFYFVLRKRSYRVSDLFIGQLLGFTAFSVYIRAAFSALLGIKLSFGVTSKTKDNAISFLKFWPQITIIILSFISIVWGINRFVYELNYAILINCFWAFYHMLILSAVFLFKR